MGRSRKCVVRNQKEMTAPKIIRDCIPSEEVQTDLLISQDIRGFFKTRTRRPDTDGRGLSTNLVRSWHLYLSLRALRNHRKMSCGITFSFWIPAHPMIGIAFGSHMTFLHLSEIRERIKSEVKKKNRCDRIEWNGTVVYNGDFSRSDKLQVSVITNVSTDEKRNDVCDNDISMDTTQGEKCPWLFVSSDVDWFGALGVHRKRADDPRKKDQSKLSLWRKFSDIY